MHAWLRLHVRFCCTSSLILSDQASENPKLRFYCSVKLNSIEVGRGLGQNKKQAKYLAARVALKNIAPTLYEEWL